MDLVIAKIVRMDSILLLSLLLMQDVHTFTIKRSSRVCQPPQRRSLGALSENSLENVLVAVKRNEDDAPCLCAVKPDGSVVPLSIREDDVETDLYADPKIFSGVFTGRGCRG
jgi:hypothetical protein